MTLLERLNTAIDNTKDKQNVRLVSIRAGRTVFNTFRKEILDATGIDLPMAAATFRGVTIDFDPEPANTDAIVLIKEVTL